MAVDPAIHAAWEFARRRGPLRRGERMLHHRFTSPATSISRCRRRSTCWPRR
jgi:hypothetical protein